MNSADRKQPSLPIPDATHPPGAASIEHFDARGIDVALRAGRKFISPVPGRGTGARSAALVAAFLSAAVAGPAGAAPVPAPRNYVALGDSFAAGAGIAPQVATGNPATCSRSMVNYPHLVAEASTSGHDACAAPGRNWITGVLPTAGAPVPMHPNAAGHVNVAHQIVEVLSR
ncbi:hypothetical protein ABZ413_16620 [Nocardia rhamnosiphila]|uniref:hypothetical protein n=1 Tax=Nocardia rhamnosiphila TaxID=426716 RepID=UPI0033D24ECB